jgi:hypothetical protein
MSNSTLTSPDLAVGQQVQVEVANGGGTKFIRVVGADGGGSGGGTIRNGTVASTDALTAAIPVPAGTDVTIYSLAEDDLPIDLAPGDTIVIVALVLFVSQNNAWPGRFTKIMTLHNRGGVLLSPNGGTTDEDVTPATSDNINPALVGTTAALFIDGTSPNQTISLTVGAHAGVDLFACAEVSFVRMGFPVPLPPPPTLTSLSVTHGPTAGGTATEATGTHLTGAFAASLNGAPTATPVGVDDDHVDLTSGPGTAGTGDAVISTPGGDATLPAAWTYETPTTPLSIFAANLTGWGPNSQIQHAGPTVTGWNNLGTGGNLALAGGGAAPAYVASSTNITPNGPSSLHAGTSQYFLDNAFAQGPATDTPIFMWVVCRVTDVAGWLAFFETLVGLSEVGTGDASMALTTPGGPVDAGENIVNELCLVMGYSDGFAGAGNTGWVAVNGHARVSRTGVGSTTLTSPGRFVVAGDLVLPTGEFFEWGAANVQPTLLQQADLLTYVETAYNGGSPLTP